MAKTAVQDILGRPVRDLRISVTDRCNFRCPYCMPREVFGPGYQFMRDPQLMTTDEIVRIAAAFVDLGVEKIRLTGGEPLLRPDLPEVVRRLKTELGVADVALTTNGWLLERHLPALVEAGLDRLNVSVDSLIPSKAGRMNGQGLSSERVLRAIDAATAAGIPVKINTVVQRGINDDEIETMAAYFRDRALPLRFIEFMDVGSSNHWSGDQVVAAATIVGRIQARWPLEAIGPAYRGEVASRYRYTDGKGEIGIIASITEPFCADCHRARLSADGKLFTCLFTSLGWSILSCLRGGADETELRDYVARIWAGRRDRYSDERAELMESGEPQAKAEMSYLGG